MFRPSLKSLWTVTTLAIISIGLFYLTESKIVRKQTKWFPQKIEAASIMEKCMISLKDETVKQGYIIDKTNDPQLTGLIGPDVSKITTSIGILSEKLTTLNPNFAAVFVDILKSAKLNKGDKVAVGMTAANPGANLALLSAMESIGLKPVIITSIGSSKYGANREDFTWLDMETHLFEKGLISNRTNYATLGGGSDRGRGLSKEGRNIIINSAKNNKVDLILGKNLHSIREKRMESFANHVNNLTEYKSFINIGGSVANIGRLVNAKLIRNGVNRNLAEVNFDHPGIFMNFVQKNIPVVHFFQMKKIANNYNLPLSPETKQEIGQGEVYITHLKDVKVASFSLAILIILIVIIVVFDRKDRHFLENIVQ
ncbi:MAG: poly-gamma-glutamate system protein, partial [Candidatus Cloacimonadota bacterium]|nr:poly-gamma-glutamate system protein [Candidatus Cloacimonadota bacterium]